MTFKDFSLHPVIMDAIEKQGFSIPTPIQAKAIPVLLEGKDVMGLAQTGTGKTAAFVLPILNKLLLTPRQAGSGTGSGKGPRALIIAPTRELAVQIDQVVQELGEKAKVRSCTVFGGVSIGPQINRLRSGVDIVVACPGRLLDHLQQETISLSMVEMLVLDEADQMFDMGFLPAIRRIARFLPAKRQSMLFSATMPEEIRSLALSMLKNPVHVDISERAPVSLISHAVYPVSINQKSDLLHSFFKNTPISSAIVFTRTKHRAKRLAESLARSGYAVTSLQGNLSQNRRQEAMEGFRSGKYNVMVATDIAARGIDISSVSHVINFDIPSTTEAYTHRIGRTGRASRSGEAYTFISAEDAQMVRAIEKVLGGPLERKTLAGFTYESVDRNQRNVSDALDYREPRPRGGRGGPRGAAAKNAGQRKMVENKRFHANAPRRP